MERDKITPLEKSIGEKIGKLRVNNGGETQESLAASIGVSREIIQHWERGTRHIKADHIKSLAQHFNVSSDYLLGLSSSEKIEHNDFAKATGFGPNTINTLLSISGYGYNSPAAKRERLSFEYLINSNDFTCILECIRAFLDMSVPAKSSDAFTLHDIIAYDEAISKRTGRRFHVIGSEFAAKAQIALAQKKLADAFDSIKNAIDKTFSWKLWDILSSEKVNKVSNDDRGSDFDATQE